MSSIVLLQKNSLLSGLFCLMQNKILLFKTALYKRKIPSMLTAFKTDVFPFPPFRKIMVFFFKFARKPWLLALLLDITPYLNTNICFNEGILYSLVGLNINESFRVSDSSCKCFNQDPISKVKIIVIT